MVNEIGQRGYVPGPLEALYTRIQTAEAWGQMGELAPYESREEARKIAALEEVVIESIKTSSRYHHSESGLYVAGPSNPFYFASYRFGRGPFYNSEVSKSSITISSSKDGSKSPEAPAEIDSPISLVIGVEMPGVANVPKHASLKYFFDKEGRFQKQTLELDRAKKREYGEIPPFVATPAEMTAGDFELVRGSLRILRHQLA